MTERSKARQRAIETAERLFRSQGYHGAGLSQILEESTSPKGSFYFHFPEGKRQLAFEVLKEYGARVDGNLRQLGAKHAGDPPSFVEALCRALSAEMRASGWKLNCAAQTLASELAPDDADMAKAVASVFEGWIETIASCLRTHEDDELTAGDARRHAIALLAALEGARTLARATQRGDAFAAVSALHGAALQTRRPSVEPPSQARAKRRR